MENLESKIQDFLTFKEDGSGSGFCYGDGSGDGDGDGYGDGSGDGFGSGDGDGYGDGSGDGYGSGYGDGSGSGSGRGRGDCIKEIDGRKIYLIDDVPTVLLNIHKNVAFGCIYRKNLQRQDCYIVKENGKFAHGKTLQDAHMALQGKLYNDNTIEGRITAFKQKFPKYDKPYNNRDLFAYHHVLTGSCVFGRKAFVTDNGLSLDGKTTVRDFIKLTEDAYGSDIIKLLPEAYGM